MKAQVKTTVRWEACDGRVFENEIDCERYEDTLPRPERYCFETGSVLSDSPATIGNYDCGYIYTWETTEYEPPAFLRQGGDYTTEHRAEEILLKLHGTIGAVIREAVQNERFWRNRKSGGFIRMAKYKSVESVP